MRTRWQTAALLGVLLVVAQSDGRVQAQTAQDLQHAIEASAMGLHTFSAAELERIVRGFQINPVPLNLRGKDIALVGLGSYHVNAAGGCSDCHTAPPFQPGGDPFLGERKRINVARYLAGGTPFGPPGDPNTPVSRNLTPRPDTGRPAGLTWPQFRRTIRTGADLKHRPPFVPSMDRDLLQVMPWPVYQELTERDLRAIYEYLRAIPSLPSMP